MLIWTLPLSSYTELAFAFWVTHKMQNVAVMQINNLWKRVPNMPQFLVSKTVENSFSYRKTPIKLFELQFFWLSLCSSRKSNPGIVVNPKCTLLCFSNIHVIFFTVFVNCGVKLNEKKFWCNKALCKLKFLSCEQLCWYSTNTQKLMSRYWPTSALLEFDEYIPEVYTWGRGKKGNWFIYNSLVLLFALWRCWCS